VLKLVKIFLLLVFNCNSFLTFFSFCGLGGKLEFEYLQAVSYRGHDYEKSIEEIASSTSPTVRLPLSDVAQL